MFHHYISFNNNNIYLDFRSQLIIDRFLLILLIVYIQLKCCTNNEVAHTFRYSETVGWPYGAHHFGQVTAVDVDSDHNIIVFHRGNHVWNERTFDTMNRYRLLDDGPISTNTIIVINPKTRKIVNEWGVNLFYLPHGLTLDRNGSIWLTDVALHQVFKYPEKGSQQPILTLGERFIPGSDENHFCKPTSVAISSTNGDIYVADGYCNSRILRFTSKGIFSNQWGQSDKIGYFSPPPPSSLNIPHKVVLIEDRNMSCVADREHGRIQCFTIPNGEFQFEILRDDFNGRLFSISYLRSDGLLFAVCGPSLYKNKDVLAFVFDISNQELVASFGPNSGSFVQPHDIAVSDDGKYAFVVEIGPNNIWMFTREQAFGFKTETENQKPRTENALNGIIVGSNSEIPMRKETTFETTTSEIIKSKIISNSHKSSFPAFISSSNTSLVVSLLVIPVLIMIIVSVIINLRKSGGCFQGFRIKRSQEKYDLGRLLGDPKKDGFNRIPIDESDGDIEENSDSEVEEFSQSTAVARKV